MRGDEARALQSALCPVRRSLHACHCDDYAIGDAQTGASIEPVASLHATLADSGWLAHGIRSRIG